MGMKALFVTSVVGTLKGGNGPEINGRKKTFLFLIFNFSLEAKKGGGKPFFCTKRDRGGWGKIKTV